MKFDPTAVKAGDRVWIGTDRYKNAPSTDYAHYHLKTVARITPTQIVLDWNGNGAYLKRYTRADGYEKPMDWQGFRIMSVATPKECAAHDEKMRREAQSAAQTRKAEENREELRKALSDLFGDENTWVTTNQAKEKFGIEGLSEEQVRLCAAALQSLRVDSLERGR